MDTTYAGIVIVPLLIALLEALKRMGLAVRWTPLAAIVLGLALSLGQLVTSGAVSPSGAYSAILTGLAIGLSAVGLYSGSRSTIGH